MGRCIHELGFQDRAFRQGLGLDDVVVLERGQVGNELSIGDQELLMRHHLQLGVAHNRVVSVGWGEGDNNSVVSVAMAVGMTISVALAVVVAVSVAMAVAEDSVGSTVSSSVVSVALAIHAALVILLKQGKELASLWGKVFSIGVVHFFDESRWTGSSYRPSLKCSTYRPQLI